MCQRLSKQGAVGLRMRIYGRIICFVNCHFAAHLEAVNRRNDDFDHIYRTMIFSRPSNVFNFAAGMLLQLFFCSPFVFLGSFFFCKCWFILMPWLFPLLQLVLPLLFRCFAVQMYANSPLELQILMIDIKFCQNTFFPMRLDFQMDIFDMLLP